MIKANFDTALNDNKKELGERGRFFKKSYLCSPHRQFIDRRRLRLAPASRFSQIDSFSANGSSLLTPFLAGYLGSVIPRAKYLRMVCRESPVLLEISRPDSLSRPCQRRITLNKSTSITPFMLLLSHQQERGLHVGQFWMQIWWFSGALLDAN